MAQDRKRNIQLESEAEAHRAEMEELQAQLEEMRVNQANVELGLLRLGFGGFSQIWDYFRSGGKSTQHARRISAVGIKSTGKQPGVHDPARRKASLPVKPSPPLRQDSAHIMSM